MLLYQYVCICRGGVFGRKKKSKRSQNNHSNNERYDNIRVFFFLELFHMSVFSFFKTLLKKLGLKFKVIFQCKLLNLTLVRVVKKAGTRASEKKGVPILE